MYKTIESLPSEIREQLPRAAQELYRAAFNRTSEMLLSDGAGTADEINAQAHNSSLLAVQEKFSLDEDGKWQHDPVGEHMKRQT